MKLRIWTILILLAGHFEAISGTLRQENIKGQVELSPLTQVRKIEKVAPGIWKVVFGIPEKIRPVDFKKEAYWEGLKKLSDSKQPPIDLNAILFSESEKGVLASFKLDSSERIYGFGLQVNTFEQRGLRRNIRTNSWVIGNIGFSHAPMPFYISSKGYGLLVNTSRYVTFYMGSQHKLEQSVVLKQRLSQEPTETASSPADLYNKHYESSDDVDIFVDGTKGIEIYVFEGPEMREVVERYNLFSGGGAIPPLWGLGLKYRAKSDFSAAEVINFSKYFRNNHIPCDMFGLEPGWQSAAYSCSYKWNEKKFPHPDSLLNIMNAMNYKLNLWEHAYVHPTSPIFDSIVPYSGNYAVWKGAVPDFVNPAARNIFGEYHKNTLIDKGMSSFKLDECDAAYFDKAQGEWSFPDIARFPSGIDGEQMRQLFGLLYQKTILDEFKSENKRTVLEARASYLFAAPYCSALYTDMYEQSDFLRMIVNSGFCGVNWSPEVRQTKSEEDLIRRLQMSVMAAHMNVDCWFLKNLPWYQYDKEKNNRGEFLPNYRELEQKAKKLIELRMSLIPYLYAAFAKYHFNGTPPFRALVLDYPNDPQVWKIDDQYMMGDAILCAPFVDGASTRKVYLPEGTWFDFNSGKQYMGGKEYTISMSLDEIPMFIKNGIILPLAAPVEYITPQTTFNLQCRIYGSPNKPVQLFEDNSYTFDFEKGVFNWVSLTWNKGQIQLKHSGNFNRTLYKIEGWTIIK
jgi:alpha-D-xyloside xylohydrolase